MDKSYLGIDPGKHGGLCVLNSSGDIVALHNMPQTPTDLKLLLGNISATHSPLVCAIERVGGMPGQGGAAMFNFGYNYGQLIQCLTDSNIAHTEILPSKWQTAMGCRGKSRESYTAHKNRIKDMVKRKFPNVKITLATADAVMIACYALAKL